MLYCFKCRNAFDMKPVGLRYENGEWGQQKLRAWCPIRNCNGMVYDLDEDIIPLIDHILEENLKPDNHFEIVPIYSCAGHWTDIQVGDNCTYILLAVRPKGMTMEDGFHIAHDLEARNSLVRDFDAMMRGIEEYIPDKNFVWDLDVDFKLPKGFANQASLEVRGWEDAWMVINAYYNPPSLKPDQNPDHMGDSAIECLKARCEYATKLTDNVKELIFRMNEWVRNGC